MWERVNTSEALTNVVNLGERKMLTRSDQKGKWPGSEAPNSSDVVDEPPAERRDPTPTGLATERGKPVVLPGDPSPGKAAREGRRWGSGQRTREKAKAAL